MENIFDSHTLNRISCPVNPYVINRMVEKEMLRVRQNCAIKEQQFIEQMFLENPISIEKCNDDYNQSLEPSCLNNDEDARKDHFEQTQSQSETEQNYRLLEPQCNEMCHYEESNMKMRKARTRYRHQYMKYRLQESYEVFMNLQDVIGKTEAKLIAQGLPPETLKFLRHQYGVDKAVQKVYTRSIQRTIKRERN